METRSFYSRVLVIGSVTISNRLPFQIEVLTSLAEDLCKFSRFYLTRDDGPENKIKRFLRKTLGVVAYHLILPVLIWRSQMIYVAPSCNTELEAIAFWSKLFRRKLVVDYYVSIYEWSCFMHKRTDPNSRIGGWLKKCDTLAAEADEVIHCNTTEWHHIREFLELPRREHRFHRVPLGSDFDKAVQTILPPPARTTTVFGWWGSSMPLHGLETIIRGFELLADLRKDFELHLLFLGEPRLRAFEEQHGMRLNQFEWLKVKFDITASDGSLQNYINERVDMGFSHFGTGPSAEYVYTNKVMESMAFGRTSIVSDCPGNYEYGDNIRDLFFVCAPTSEGIRDAAIEAMDNRASRGKKELLCLELFKSQFSSDAVKKRFRAALLEIYANA